MTSTLAAPAGQPVAQLQSSPKEPGLSPCDVHVLLVDDEKLSRTVVSSLLRRCSYRGTFFSGSSHAQICGPGDAHTPSPPLAVTTAENGAKAMELLQASPPGTFHLVLTDVCMPEVDGIQLLQYVKQEENLRSVPVIMMSSIDKDDTVYECVSSGAEEYLVKPVTRKEVQHMWQHVVRKRSTLATVPQDTTPTTTATANAVGSTSDEDTEQRPQDDGAADTAMKTKKRVLASTAPTAPAAATLAQIPSPAPHHHDLPQTTTTTNDDNNNKNVDIKTNLESTKQFLLLMKETRDTQVAEIKRQLNDIDADIATYASTTTPRHDRKRAKCAVDSRWEAIESQSEKLEPLYYDRRRASQLPTLARDLNILSRTPTLKTLTSLRAGDIASPQEMVCCADFDADDSHFATVSVSRSVKVFDFAAVKRTPTALHVPVWQANTRSKLSSVSWNAYIRPHLITSDYDGVVQLWDVGTGCEVAQYDDHSRRVWSVDFSRADPLRFASGSDDATVRVWSVNDPTQNVVMRAPANVCSVQFSPTNGNLVAAGCANHKVYLYDLRRPESACGVLRGNMTRAASYVRFLGGDVLVAASTDNAVRMFDIGGGRNEVMCTYTGHKNERNFVGLSVTEDGYIATGSEDNRVYVYYKTLPFAIARTSLNGDASGDGGDGNGVKEKDRSSSSNNNNNKTFTSSVCWARAGGYCLAANSQGVLSVLSMTTKNE